jgi:uncharacterized protein (TIGR03437 family)
MQQLHLALIFLATAALLSQPASAQPTIAANGIRNSASYALPGLPDAGIAKGSIFVIFGQNLGPRRLSKSAAFQCPVQADWRGHPSRSPFNGTSVYAIMLYALATQVAAVLPSDTPIGTGTVSVTYNGQTSNLLPARLLSPSPAAPW